MRTARIPRGIRSLPRKESLSERIYYDLRERLQRGAIGPEERLVDKDLAAAYQTSRMPAREALLRLVNDGYLTGTTRGFAVPTLSPEQVGDLFEVRRLLEPYAAADAAKHLDAAALAQLADALHQARAAVRANNGEEMILANMAFRNAWLGCVSNRSLAENIARFVDHVQTVRLSTLSNPATRKVDMDGLEGLYEALVKRDSAKVRTRMAAFLAAAERAFFAARAAELAAAFAAAAPARPRLRKVR